MRTLAAFQSDRGDPFKTRKEAIIADLMNWVDDMEEEAAICLPLDKVTADYFVTHAPKIIAILSQNVAKVAG